MDANKFLEWQAQFQGQDYPSELWEKIEKLQQEKAELEERIQQCRDYLMSSGNVTASEALIELGFDENGF